MSIGSDAQRKAMFAAMAGAKAGIKTAGRKVMKGARYAKELAHAGHINNQMLAKDGGRYVKKKVPELAARGKDYVQGLRAIAKDDLKHKTKYAKDMGALAFARARTAAGKVVKKGKEIVGKAVARGKYMVKRRGMLKRARQGTNVGPTTRGRFRLTQATARAKEHLRKKAADRAKAFRKSA